jgi:hypothetical protein
MVFLVVLGPSWALLGWEHGLDLLVGRSGLNVGYKLLDRRFDVLQVRFWIERLLLVARVVRYLVDVLLMGSGYVTDSFERHFHDFGDVAPFLGGLHIRARTYIKEVLDNVRTDAFCRCVHI